MLLFRSEAEVDAWCMRTGEPRGEIVPLSQVWRLAREWYGDRMIADFRGRTSEEAIAVFARAGLTSAFWSSAA